MKTLLIAALAGAALAVPSAGWEDAVLLLSGASCVEELDESTLERYQALAARPLDLNLAGRSRLLSCGLFSAFQVASLMEYRQESGEVLSFSELALVDGFNPEMAETLKHFVRLEATRVPGKGRSMRFHNDLTVRASGRTGTDGPQFAAGLKEKASLGETFELNWSTRTTYSDPSIKLGTISAAAYGRKYLGKVVLGHFGARFGQGLTQWSGFCLQPYSGVGALRRSGTGFSATGSFRAELCGVAADFNLGRWALGAGWSFTGNLPIANVSYTGTRFSAGLTATSRAIGADWRLGLKNTSFYGELAWNGAPQAAAGVMWVPVYGSEAGGLLRYIDGVPEGIAAARHKDWEALVAVSSKQFRVMGKYSPQLRPWLGTSLRLLAKKTDVWRFEVRGELKAAFGHWGMNARGDLVHCAGWAWLANAEAFYEGTGIKAYLRGTVFNVDKWPDRIYVYERDVPGSFNVPAYYGRGWAVSAYAAWALGQHHTLNLRASWIAYPWMEAPKPSRAELRLQYRLSL